MGQEPPGCLGLGGGPEKASPHSPGAKGGSKSLKELEFSNCGLIKSARTSKSNWTIPWYTTLRHSADRKTAAFNALLCSRYQPTDVPLGRKELPEEEAYLCPGGGGAFLLFPPLLSHGMERTILKHHGEGLGKDTPLQGRPSPLCGDTRVRARTQGSGTDCFVANRH